MICVYAPDCTDFLTNGYGPVSSSSCAGKEPPNGEWELTLTYPLDDVGKWQRLAKDACCVFIARRHCATGETGGSKRWTGYLSGGRRPIGFTYRAWERIPDPDPVHDRYRSHHSESNELLLA